MGGGPDRRRAPHRARAGRLAGAHDRPRPPGRLLLPPRRALGDGGQRLPPRRLRRLLDGRRHRRLGRDGLPLEPDGRACRGPLGRCLALVAAGARGAAQAPPPHRASCASATSTRPSTSPRRRDDARGCSSSSRAGWSSVVRNGTTLAAPFLDLTGESRSAEDERGLLSIAFPPDYETSGLFYVYLTAQPAASSRCASTAARPTDPDRADPAGRDRVATRTTRRASNHNGGQIQFGPDGMLWIAHRRRRRPQRPFGQRPATSAAQLGKLLRIDPRPGNAGAYTVPADNPFGTARVGLRPAQPVPLLVRPRGRRPRDRRRRPGRARGDRLRALRRRPRRDRRLRLALLRGHDPRPAPPARPAAATSRRSSTTQPAQPARGDRRRRRARPRPADAAGRYLYADCLDRRSALAARSAAPRADRRPRRGGSRRGPRASSFGEDACGHVYVVSSDGTVDRLAGRRRGACVLAPPAPSGTAPPAAPPAGPARPDRTVAAGAGRAGAQGPLGLRARRGSRSPPRGLPRDGDRARRRVAQARAHARCAAGRRTILRLRIDAHGREEAAPQALRAPAARDARSSPSRRVTRPATARRDRAG